MLILAKKINFQSAIIGVNLRFNQINNTLCSLRPL
mgnify:CR=1 FL=1